MTLTPEPKVPPQRTCIGCRRVASQIELLRCVLGADERAQVSRIADGRGAWLCAGSQRCFEVARKRKAFGRAWKCQVSDEALAPLNDTFCKAFEADTKDVKDLQAVGLRSDTSAPMRKG